MNGDDTQGLEESGVEVVQSEVTDLEASPPRYEIVTYPADYTLEGLVTKYRRGQIRIPGFQRKFVWRLPQASRLIESFLLGLPVPAIFLYVDATDNTLQVIDGQQRLLSVVYFFEGFFGPPEHGKRIVFSLQGLNEKSPYYGKTLEDLRTANEPAFNQLSDSVLRAFVVKQLDPADETSIYHVFERLNTGGVQLASQEIRNCIYHGPLNELLGQLNREGSWRRIFGKAVEDKRQRDVELILRFLALSQASETYEKPMKDFLSKFMLRNRAPGDERIEQLRQSFFQTAETVAAKLGDRPFNIRAGLNAAVFDAVFVAIGRNLGRVPEDLPERYQGLLRDEQFRAATTSGTTDIEIVRKRLALAEKTLIG